VLALLLGLAVNATAATPFSNPPELASEDGVLEGTLRVGSATVAVGAKEVTTTVYDGLLMPPVLRVQPGDQVQLRLQNDASFSTNVHYHGFQVTPLGRGDNVFLNIVGGETFQYDFAIPPDHPSGLYWYHPHFHPDVNPQIAGGMSGGIIVGNVLEPFPELTGITERVILLKDTKIRKGQVLEDPGPTGPTTRTVNGLFKPTIDIQPGELQFWRIGNIGANIYYDLELAGHTFYVLVQDGNLKNQLVATGRLLIPPAARYEVLVRGAKRGKYPLKARRFDTGPAGDHYPPQKLATLVSSGDAVNGMALPTVFPSPPDLRQQPVPTARTIVFADADSDNPSEQFTINGKFYDHDRVDTTVTLGHNERWLIQNTSKELHVFHIHQTDFQVVSINGVAQPFTGYQDTVSLPYATRQKGQLVPGTVEVIIPFTNPVMVGEFVYHCHIVQHADQGMMANIEVVPGP
jgi:FtsP/CotA-like multicopper oxidase with cupredoxin domain